MAKLITVYWRDIPAQVIGRQGRENFKKELSPRFAKAIDRAAMRAGRGSSDAYLDDWRRVSRRCDTDLEQTVHGEVEKLEREFSGELLENVVKAGGVTNTPAD
jgi:Virulence factor